MKLCTKCKLYKSSNEFYKRRTVKDGLCSWCKKCQNKLTTENRNKNKKHYKDYMKAYNKSYRELHGDALKLKSKEQYRKYCKYNPNYPRAVRLKRDYNMSLLDYNKLLKSQNSRCAICKEKFEQLHVDHDHKTKKIRGLLCNSCNSGLGFFKDKIELLDLAKAYLQHD